MDGRDPEMASYLADGLWRRVLIAAASGELVPVRKLASLALLAQDAQSSDPAKRQLALEAASAVTEVV